MNRPDPCPSCGFVSDRPWGICPECAAFGPDRVAPAYRQANRTPGYVEASVNLRTYLRTAADPESAPEQAIAAFEALSEDDRALVVAYGASLTDDR